MLSLCLKWLDHSFSHVTLDLTMAARILSVAIFLRHSQTIHWLLRMELDLDYGFYGAINTAIRMGELSDRPPTS